MNFGSLFSGIGGFDLGFERAGMSCAWQVEIDEKCRAVLTRHWPDVPKYEDVRNVGKRELGAVDLICGGFPCQDLSVAGQRAGLAGERSGLWFEFHRILAELKPRWVVIENVPGLLSSNGGADFAVILRGLVQLGYGVSWRVLDAQFFGVPQRRRRVFIVGSLGNGCSAQVLFEREGSTWDPPPSRETGQGFARDVAQGFTSTGRGFWREGKPTETVRQWKDGGNGLVAIDVRNLSQSGDVTHPLQSKATGGYSLNYQPVVAFDPCAQGSERTRIVRSGEYAQMIAGRPDAIAFDRTRGTSSGDIAGPLRKCGATTEGVNDAKADTQCVAFQPRYARNERGAPDTVAAPLTAEAGRTGKGDSAQCVAFTERTRADGRNVETQADLSYALTNPGNGGRTQERRIAGPWGVRRLTPTECERLQGFPDGWTEYSLTDVRLCGNMTETTARRLQSCVENVQFRSATETLLIGRRASVSCTINDSDGTALSICRNVGNANLKNVPYVTALWGRADLEAFVDGITNRGNVTATLCGQAKILRSGKEIEEILDENIDVLWKISSVESYSPENLSTILIWIKQIIRLITCTSVKDTPSTCAFIVLWNESPPRFCKEQIFSLRMGNTRSQSDSARYRQLGNAVEVDCAEWIGYRIAVLENQ